MPLFFVSYARSDTDGYLERFIRDLTDEVRRKLGKKTEDDIRFWDSHEIELGDQWPERICEALRQARVCLCLLSPAYFDSEFCGKEFQVFRRRSGGRAPKTPQAGIFPLLWETPRGSIPEALCEYQYTHPDFPEVYTREGLRYLMKLGRHRDDYLVIVDRLASLLITAAQSSPLPEIEELEPLSGIANAFHRDALKGQAVTTGPSNVRFVFLAAPASEMKLIRSDVRQYDNQGGWYWRPYLDISAGKLAQLTATQLDFRYDELTLSDDLIHRLKEAEKRNEIVILLVDPWTMRIPWYANLIEQYDNVTLINCSLLVPWNDDDPETANDLKQLQGVVSGAFPRKLILNPPAHEWDSIRSSSHFSLKLGEALEKVRMLILQFGSAGRKAHSNFIAARAQAAGIPIVDKPSLVTPIKEGP